MLGLLATALERVSYCRPPPSSHHPPLAPFPTHFIAVLPLNSYPCSFPCPFHRFFNNLIPLSIWERSGGGGCGHASLRTVLQFAAAPAAGLASKRLHRTHQISAESELEVEEGGSFKGQV